jgi:1-deoxy-D-xylulose-5-phosphate reductoisomerase
VGGTAPAILNAANEAAVEAFLAGAIGFWQIQACVSEVLASISIEPAHTLEQVMDTDRRARAAAAVWIRQHPV